MPLPLEDYALIGDTETAALVGSNGSIDWLCVPRFDSGACFAALLGGPEHGHWQVAPAGGGHAVRRRYRPGSLVLETDFETADGAVQIVDCMPVRDQTVDLVRLVRGVRGRVPMQMELVIRYDYGAIVPWVVRSDGGIIAVAGPDALVLRVPFETRGLNLTTVAEFTVSEGDEVPLTLQWYESHHPAPPSPIDASVAVAATDAWWQTWSGRCHHRSSPLVLRSAITLKALTYAPTGGIVAAPTTSLPEQLGGVRNWDYRYCWLRDAVLTLVALMRTGYIDEAQAWRDWLLRAVAGDPADLQIMYGCAGERRLTEFEVDWLPGYSGARPVRIGNAASEQFQLDVYGEVIGAMFMASQLGMASEPAAIPMWAALMDFLESGWKQPDEGIWEVRGPRRHFVHSKVMAWTAFDRAAQLADILGATDALTKYRATRDEIHAEVCAKGFDSGRNTFTQSYGSKGLDAAALMIPTVGFLAPDDPRVTGTVDAIGRELMVDGFVARYDTTEANDGLPPGEGAFLPCSFWYVDCLALIGRVDEARAMFDRLAGLANDVGLLAEEYDAAAGRLVGNFPQAFTHVGLLNSAINLEHHAGPAATPEGAAAGMGPHSTPPVAPG